MAQVETEYFGTTTYREDSVFDFPAGLPAFLNEKRFVPIESPQHSPMLFLQSLIQPSLCFLALPIQVVDAEYRLAVSREDLIFLDLPSDRQPLLESEVAVLVLLSLHGGLPATANLMAPIVVNLRRGGLCRPSGRIPSIHTNIPSRACGRKHASTAAAGW